jgi:hypothetical protein
MKWDPIEIVLRQATDTASLTQGSGYSPGQAVAIPKSEEKKKNIFESTVFAGATHVARSAINTSISQYANLTGDYVVGNALQSYSTLLTYGLAVAKGGPIGMVYAAVSLGQSAVNEYIKHVKNERELDMMKKRAGFIYGGAGLTND